MKDKFNLKLFIADCIEAETETLAYEFLFSLKFDPKEVIALCNGMILEKITEELFNQFKQ